MKKKDVLIIGAGLSGLSSAALLAHRGYNVTLLEKHTTPGGVARSAQMGDYTFDMGPTWYLMPGVFERFFSELGEDINDHLNLIDLDPSYRLFFEEGERFDITRDMDKNRAVFESLEMDGGKKLDRYLADSKYKLDTALDEFLYRDYTSIFDFLNRKMLIEGPKLQVFSKLDNHAKRFFASQKARKILEYNIVFLGCSPYKSPALYSLMSWVDLAEGVRYPEGGIHSLVRALEALAIKRGVTIHYNTPVDGIIIKDRKARALRSGEDEYSADIILSAADYHHTETELMPQQYRNYSSRYWEKKLMAPTAFLIYLGIKKKIPELAHHNIYLTSNWEEHFDTIFDHAAWPENPSYYVGCPSKTDPHVAPAEGEALFILVPVAPGLEDTDEIRDTLASSTIAHLEKITGTSFKDDIEEMRIVSHRDFIEEGNLYRGSSLGLAHTLFQSAVFRPSHRNKKIANLYYTSHYTHPGIGMPMVLISSEVVAQEIEKDFS